MVGQQQNERILLDLIHAGVADDKLRELFHPMLDGADFDLLRRVKIASQLSDEALELMTDLPRLAGSNAWAVSPKRSATGSALLACDPHLEVNRLPAIWYEAELHWETDDQGFWYDFAVTCDSDAAFYRRLAGRIETGRHTVSDPAFGMQDL